MEKAWERIQEFIADYGLSLIGALLIFLIGRWAAKVIKGLVARMMNKSKADPTLVAFVSNLVYIGLLTFVFIAALAQLGVQTTSFIAVIGAAGLAVGLALQGALANFAAGVLLLWPTSPPGCCCSSSAPSRRGISWKAPAPWA